MTARPLSSRSVTHSLARGRRSRWLKRAAVAVLAVAGGRLANVKRQEAEISRGEAEAVTAD